jgi:hypothetical protein
MGVVSSTLQPPYITPPGTRWTGAEPTPGSVWAQCLPDWAIPPPPFVCIKTKQLYSNRSVTANLKPTKWNFPKDTNPPRLWTNTTIGYAMYRDVQQPTTPARRLEVTSRSMSNCISLKHTCMLRRECPCMDISTFPYSVTVTCKLC